MASLLERARRIREQQKISEEIASIPDEEREDIYKEIEKTVALNRLQIRENTFVFQPIRSDRKLPFLINAGAVLIIALLAISFYFVFNRAETHLVREAATVQTAESDIIKTLKAESEQKIGEKDQEIHSIQDRLDEMRRKHDSILQTAGEELSRKEEELKRKYENELEMERQKLQNQGLTSVDIDSRIAELERTKSAEYQTELAAFKKDMEEKRQADEKQIADLIQIYENNLKAARDARTALQDNLKNQLEGERDQALNTLDKLNSSKKEEDFVLSQINSLYSSVNREISDSQFDGAAKTLDALENYLNQSDVASLDFVRYRRDTDMFLIGSLRKLVTLEQAALQKAAVPEEAVPQIVEDDGTRNILLNVSQTVKEGNSLYNQGDVNGARKAFLRAISLIPAVDEGYKQLGKIDAGAREEEKRRFDDALKSGENYYSAGDFQSAVLRYKRALEYFVDDGDSVDLITRRLVDSGAHNSLVSTEDLKLIEQAKSRERSRRELLDKLTSLESNFQPVESGTETSTDTAKEIIPLLGTKFLIQEVLASDTIREKYPDLYEKMEQYLSAFGQKREQEGRNAALAEILSLTEKLKSSDATAQNGQGDPFLQFLQNLKEIFEEDM